MTSGEGGCILEDACAQDGHYWVFFSVAELEPVEPKLFWDLEPEPKTNFNKLFLQSVLRMLG